MILLFYGAWRLHIVAPMARKAFGLTLDWYDCRSGRSTVGKRLQAFRQGALFSHY